MEFIKNFPFFTIVLSLLCSVIAFAFQGKKARFVSYGLLSVSIGFTFSVLIYNLTQGEGYFVYRMGHYDAPFGNEISAGIVEPVILLLFEVVMLLSVIGGLNHIIKDIDETKHKFFFVMINLLHASLAALCYTNDIFTAYVFVEICTISSCALLMLRNAGKPLVAATRYMIFSLIGSGLFLIGIIMMYAITGHLLFPQLYETVQKLIAEGKYTLAMAVSCGLMTLGLCVKSGLFPFHLWMPDTYGTATPAASGILSGVVSKGYIFLLMKIMYRVVGFDSYQHLGVHYFLYAFGLLGMIFGSVSAIRAKNLNYMIAYSSAAQIGYIYMGFGLGTKEAYIASIFQIIAHSLTKPLLFLCSSHLEDTNGGNNSIASLKGSARADKLAGIGFFLGSLSMIGIPLFAGFIPKLSFTLAAFGHGAQTYITLIVLAISTMLNVVYFLRTVLIIYADSNEKLLMPAPSFARITMAGVIVLMVVMNIAVGSVSQPIQTILERGIDIFTNIR